ncbi:MAG TPA: response regulator transcription factor [Candidatus Dormibacteraeota bacterium]|nr:response regulator transcription factor [Candidatus Dormibacteraeota bacterium]
MVAPERQSPTGDGLMVLLVDRHALFLAALSKVIAENREAEVEITTSSEQALEMLAERPVDLIICELRSEPVAGPELVTRARQLNPTIRGVLLADPEDAEALVEALSSGAVGFFTKDASPEEFLEGIEAVLAGHFVVGRNVVRSTPDDAASIN